VEGKQRLRGRYRSFSRKLDPTKGGRRDRKGGISDKADIKKTRVRNFEKSRTARPSRGNHERKREKKKTCGRSRAGGGGIRSFSGIKLKSGGKGLPSDRGGGGGKNERSAEKNVPQGSRQKLLFTRSGQQTNPTSRHGWETVTETSCALGGCSAILGPKSILGPGSFRLHHTSQGWRRVWWVLLKGGVGGGNRTKKRDSKDSGDAGLIGRAKIFSLECGWFILRQKGSITCAGGKKGTGLGACLAEVNVD